MWLQIHIVTTKGKAPLVELLFEGMGALSVTMEDAEDEPMLEPAPGETPLWSQTRVTGLFSEDSDQEDLVRHIREQLQPDSGIELTVERLADQVWERVWLDDFRPMRFGQRLWIAPDGQIPGDPDAISVQLDPGLAFGTGTHPTTALCLRWLDQADMVGKSVIDFGCGSGILSIAAMLLGAKEVVAIDHDPQAIEATADNAEKNQIKQGLTILHSAQPLEIVADITLANILAATLIELKPLFARHTKGGGQIILSGILEEQADAVIAAFADDFSMQAPIIEEGWVLLYGQRC